MASTTATREKEQQKTDDIAIVTSDEEQGVGDGNMEPVQHILIERKCLEWASPKQSFFCCAFYSILCILVGIIIVFTNNPTYDQEYNTPAQIFVTQNISLNVSEWQFNEHYVKGTVSLCFCFVFFVCLFFSKTIIIIPCRHCLLFLFFISKFLQCVRHVHQSFACLFVCELLCCFVSFLILFALGWFDMFVFCFGWNEMKQ